MSDKESDHVIDGVKAAARILSRMEPENQERIVAHIQDTSPELATQITESMFTFDDIAGLSDRGIQVLAQRVEHDDLVLSLKKASDETKTRIYENVSARKKGLIESDYETLPPSHISDVHKAQQRVLATLDELRKEGKIIDEAEKSAEGWIA
jgi:flagellar motor switch protein FliG